MGEIDSDGFPLGQTQFTDVYVSAEGADPRRGEVSREGELGERLAPAGVLRTRPARTPAARSRARPGRTSSSWRCASTRRRRSRGRSRRTCSSRPARPTPSCSCSSSTARPTARCSTSTAACCARATAQIDRSQSQFTADGRIYRPWRPHTERSLVTPGEVVDYLIDVFPVGHVFLPGHELVVKVHAPPLDDNDYAYVQKTLPGVNTLHFGRRHPVAPDAPADPDERGPGLPGPGRSVRLRVDALHTGLDIVGRMDASTLERLAELVVGFGANVQRDQIVAVTCEPGKEDARRARSPRARTGAGRSSWTSRGSIRGSSARASSTRARRRSSSCPTGTATRILALGDQRAARIGLSGPSAPGAARGPRSRARRQGPPARGQGVRQGRQRPHDQLVDHPVPDAGVGRARVPRPARRRRRWPRSTSGSCTSCGSTRTTRSPPGAHAPTRSRRRRAGSPSAASTRSTTRARAPT